MENNNGRGIFYGVMGVATLIVTIIGATFAFFAASANTQANAIQTTAASIGLTMSVDTSRQDDIDQLIPVDANGDGGLAIAQSVEGGLYNGQSLKSKAFSTFPVAQSGATVDKNCLDTNGNQICTIYQFTVTNPTEIAQEIYLYMVVESNELDGLHYALFRGTAAQVDTEGWYVDAAVKSQTDIENGTGTYANTTYKIIGADGEILHRNQKASTTASTIYLTNTREILAPASNASANSRTFSVISWLQETGQDQSTLMTKQASMYIVATTSAPDLFLDNHAAADAGITGRIFG